MDNLSKVLGWLVLIIIAILSQAFVLTVMWGWFVVPLGVMNISMAHAFGLSLITSLFTSFKSSDKKDNDDFSQRLVTIICSYWFVLLFGWIAQTFM